MKEQLIKLLENSKSPYFNFQVACILECNDGSLYPGVNVETSSPAAGICAERNAIYGAIARGKNKEDFKALYLMAKKDTNITPCFICRQTLIDYCNPDMDVITYYGDQTSVKKVAELTPYSFSEEDL